MLVLAVSPETRGRLVTRFVTKVEARPEESECRDYDARCHVLVLVLLSYLEKLEQKRYQEGQLDWNTTARG